MGIVVSDESYKAFVAMKDDLHEALQAKQSAIEESERLKKAFAKNFEHGIEAVYELGLCKQMLEEQKRHADRLGDQAREKHDKLLEDLRFVRGERDKLAAELEEADEGDGTQFGKALADLLLYHQERLEALPPDGEADDIDPFRHQANSYKHGMGIDSFPLVQVEEALFSNDMGSYESWRRIAHAAVLAMSYLSYVREENLETGDEVESEGESPSGDSGGPVLDIA